MKKIPWVWVVNGSDHELTDRFDGEEYVFPPGKPIEIPADGAKLIFGWGEDNKYRALQRLGWVKTNLDLDPALARLKKFVFYTDDPRSPPHAPVGGEDGASDSDSSVSGSGAAAAKPWLKSPFKQPQREAPAP